MPGNVIKGVAVADLHIGVDNVGGLNKDGAPARVDDFFAALDKAIDYATEDKVDLFVIAGDLTKGRNPPMRIVARIVEAINYLMEEGISVLAVRGNHDGDGRKGWPSLPEVLRTMGVASFEDPHRHDIWLPKKQRTLRTIGVPWPSFRHLVGDHPELNYEELTRAADAALRAKIIELAAEGRREGPTLFVGHLSVAGADRASDQWMTLGWEPALTVEDFPEVFDLVILGHYHRGCRFPGKRPIIYCGSLNTIDFGEEGQDKMFWAFELGPDGHAELEPVKVNDRGFHTYSITVGSSDLLDGAVTPGLRDLLRNSGPFDGQVVRMRVDALDSEAGARIDRMAIERWFREHGAWWIHSIEVTTPEQSQRRTDGDGLAMMAPEELLDRYLRDSGMSESVRQVMVDEGRKIMEVA